MALAQLRNLGIMLGSADLIAFVPLAACHSLRHRNWTTLPSRQRWSQWSDAADKPNVYITSAPSNIGAEHFLIVLDLPT
jgi:hypothetical protein